MSKTDGSWFSLWTRAVRRRGVGDQVVGNNTSSQAEYFHGLYDDKDVGTRKKDAADMTNTFYDLVTDFYETGWGQSFHFAPRGDNETFRESIARHEYYIASRIGITEKDKVLDCGCGIGGPMRNIAQFTQADITGITINEYQINRGNAINKQVGLDKIARLEVMDFMNMTYEDNSFDKCYSIEATCHAGRREDVFKEIFRVLKPGAMFASYEWVMTDKWDPKNEKHNKAKREIEKGNSLPEICTVKEAEDALQAVGFEMVASRDLAEMKNGHGPVPWYASLQARCTMENIHHSHFALYLTHALCWTLETVGLAPKGTVRTHEFLITGRDGLVAAGEMGIFTPMHLLVGRKPLKE